MSELWGCVTVVQLAVQAGVRVRPALAGRAVAVMQGARPAERVCSVNVRGRSIGLREGMTRVEVETFEDVAVLARSGVEEDAAQRVLLEAMGGFSPRVEAKPCGADWECVVDLAGTERLLGNSSAVGERIVRCLQSLGFAGFCCVAANADAGLSVARFGGWSLADAAQSLPPLLEMKPGSRVRAIPTGREGWALAGLPLAVLRLEDEMHERFALWGVRTLGELAALPETALIVRVGQAGKTLRRRARGELPYCMKPAEERFRLEEIVGLEEPVDTLEPLLGLMDSMLQLLLQRAMDRALALASVTVSFALELPSDRSLGADESREDAGLASKTAGQFSRTIQPAVATLDRVLLLKMLELDLQAHPAPGAVVQVRLAAEPGSATRIQLGLFAPQMPEPTRFEDTHARLVALVGEGNAGRVRLLDTHAAEDFALERFVLPSAEYKACPPRAASAMPATALRRLRPAPHVRISIEGTEILGFWLEGRRFEVVRCHGPWRTSGAWWAGKGWSEDTWDLASRCEADGEVLICLLGHDLVRDAWLLEGVYD